MTQPRETGIDGLDAFYALSALLETLSRRFKALAAQPIQSVAEICDYCAGNHPSHQCTINFESVHYGGDYPNNYAYPNNYYQDWGYHPDFSLSHNNKIQTFDPSQSYIPEFQDPVPPHEERKPSLKEVLAKFITASEKRINEQDKLLNQVDLNVKSETIN